MVIFAYEVPGLCMKCHLRLELIFSVDGYDSVVTMKNRITEPFGVVIVLSENVRKTCPKTQV